MTRNPRSLTRKFLLPVLLLTSLGSTAALNLDPGKSRVSATFRQMNVPVEGLFTQVSGQIVFDASKPEASTAGIQITTAGFDLGAEDYNAEVRKKEWFDSKTFPQATFVSTGFKPLGGDRYQASGQLRACPRFCVNGLLAGNCLATRSSDDRREEARCIA